MATFAFVVALIGFVVSVEHAEEAPNWPLQVGWVIAAGWCAVVMWSALVA